MEKQLMIKTKEVIDVPALTPVSVSRPAYSAEPQSGSVLDYWRTIWQRKLLLTMCGLAGLGLGVAVTLPQTPMYRANTSIEIQDAKDDNLAARMLTLQQQPDSPAVDSFTDIQTQIKILASRTLIEKALDKTNISSVANLERPSDAATTFRSLFHMPAPEANHDALVEAASKNLKVSAVNQTRIIEVSYDAADPALAARFTNALTSEFIEQNLQARFEMNRKTSEWLVSQVDEMRGKLQQSEDALQAYARRQGLIYAGSDRQIVSEEKLRELQSELSKAQADRVEKQSRFEIARSSAPGSVPEVLNDGNVRAMESNLVDLQKQEAEMAVTFKPDYTKAKALRAEIESLQSAIEGKRGTIISRLDNELQESERREQLLGAAYQKQTRLVTDDSEKSVQYDMLKHDVDTNRQIYSVMLQRVKESGITSALKATNVRVIDPAKAPQHPYTPKLPMNAGAGLLIGLMLGVVGVVVRSKANGTLQEPGDAGLLLGIPELGVIPSAAEFDRNTPSVSLFSREKGQNTLLLTAGAGAQSPKTADSFRAVLASILFATQKQRQLVLVVTSASPGEGKTTTTSNLATTLARMGRKVLLIDGDIRSPRLHSIFSLENSVGLTTTLDQSGLTDAQVDGFIQKTSIMNLDVLTSGPSIQAGADLLFSTSMPALIARYRSQYDMVLIDTAPMLIMPDARVLGRIADGVVLIAKAGQTTRSAIDAAYRRLIEDGTPVLGVVLNDWNAKLSAYKYYSHYQDAAVETAVIKRTAA